MNKPTRKDLLKLAVLLLTIFVAYRFFERWDSFKEILARVFR